VRKILLIALLSCANYVFAQDTTYYDNKWYTVGDKSAALYYRFVQFQENDSDAAIVRVYYISGKIKTERHYSSYSKKIQQGTEIEWDENGQVTISANYNEGMLDGERVTYYSDGKLKEKGMYKNGIVEKSKQLTAGGEEMVFAIVEHPPQFPGGEDKMYRFLKKKIKYPKDARWKGIQGKVFITFVVTRDGSVTDVRIVRGVSKEIDAEALRVIKLMPKWTPGTQNGRKVNVQFNLPINFALRD